MIFTRLRHLSTPAFGIAIFALAFTVRAGLVLGLGTYTHLERSEPILTAISLAERGVFHDAFGFGSGPTAHVAPLYPLMLSVIFRVFGTGIAGEIAQELFSCFGSALIYAFLPWLATCFGLRRTVGVLAGVMGASIPVNFWPETKGSFESAYGALFFVLATGVSLTIWRKQTPTWRYAITCGAIWGVALLTFPSVLLPMIAVLVLTLYLERNGARQWIRFALLQVFVTVLVLSPWAIRNRLVLGEWIWLRSNLGLELSLAYNDAAAPDMGTNMWHGLYQRHPHANHHERAILIRMGEAAYNKARMNEALSWMRRHPRRTLQLTLERVWLFWFPVMVRWPQTVFMTLFTLSALCGFCVLVLRRDISALWLGALLFTYPLIYYVVQSFSRYRHGIDWALWLLSSTAVLAAVEMAAARYRAGLRGATIAAVREHRQTIS